MTTGNRTTLGAVVGAMGIVFGDIATSPLYTLQECLAGPHGVAPVPANVLGCVSLIVWSLLFVVTLKYVGVLMQADNRGEGGIMALLALVPRGSRERAAGVLGTTTLMPPKFISSGYGTSECWAPADRPAPITAI